MQVTYTVRLRERGQLTLPQAVRRKLAVDEGDILTLVRFLTLNTRHFTPAVAAQSGLRIQTPAQRMTELRDLVTQGLTN